MLHKTRAFYFLNHSCLIWFFIVIGSLQNLRGNEETFEAGFGKILRGIQAGGSVFYITFCIM